MSKSVSDFDVREALVAIDAVLRSHDQIGRKGTALWERYFKADATGAANRATIGHYAAALGGDARPFFRWLALAHNAWTGHPSNVPTANHSAAENAWPDAYAALQDLRHRVTAAPATQADSGPSGKGDRKPPLTTAARRMMVERLLRRTGTVPKRDLAKLAAELGCSMRTLQRDIHELRKGKPPLPRARRARVSHARGG